MPKPSPKPVTVLIGSHLDAWQCALLNGLKHGEWVWIGHTSHLHRIEGLTACLPAYIRGHKYIDRLDLIDDAIRRINAKTAPTHEVPA